MGGRPGDPRHGSPQRPGNPTRVEPLLKWPGGKRNLMPQLDALMPADVYPGFDGRLVKYDFNELDELHLSYATTIHKSQGSQFPVVVMPIHTQHYMMLQRGLLYTGVTRARKLVVLVGIQKAMAMAVRNVDARRRVTLLKQRLQATGGGSAPMR